MGGIFHDYLNGGEALRSFYSAPPQSLFVTPPKAAPWPGELVDALRAYQESLGNPCVFDGTEAVVVTGQQPGVFAGPLYTVYKAITAIKLADRVSRVHDVPCVPVFWVGSEDHDFEEARVAHVLTKSHEPLALRYEPDGSVEDLPMYRVPVEPFLHDLVDTAADITTGSEHREEIRGVLHDTLKESRSLADWTAHLLARLFRETPLVIFAPHLPEVRRLSIPVLERAIEQPLEDTRLLRDQGIRLAEKGYDAQLVKEDADCNFFLEVEGRRRKVMYENGAFEVVNESLRFSKDEMRTLLHAEPERFSPNVALRCVVQQHLFPAAAYVAGPGEVAYWAQLKPFFEYYEMRMPVVYPRAQCVLTSIKLNKLLRKYGFTLEDLAGEPDALLETALATGAQGAVVKKYKERRSGVEQALASLLRDVKAEKLGEPLQQRVEAELDRFERTLLRADEAAVEAARQQVLRLCNTLAPWRKPQERVYTVFSFLFEQGWGLIDRLVRELDIETFAVNEVEL